MIIEEKDFRLIPIGDSVPLFDLELLYTIKSRNKEERQEFKNVAYGIKLSTAIKMIAQFRISNKHKDESIKLITYFSEFKKELNSLKELCEI